MNQIISQHEQIEALKRKVTNWKIAYGVLMAAFLLIGAAGYTLACEHQKFIKSLKPLYIERIRPLEDGKALIEIKERTTGDSMKGVFIPFQTF